MIQLSDCYRALGLPPGAAPDEVRRAYRDLVKVWHPDRFAHDPEMQQRVQEKLKEINEAWEALQALWARKAENARPRTPSPPPAQTPARPGPAPRRRPSPLRSWALAAGISILALMGVARLAVTGRGDRDPGQPGRSDPAIGGLLGAVTSAVQAEPPEVPPELESVGVDAAMMEQLTLMQELGSRRDTPEPSDPTDAGTGIMEWTVHDDEPAPTAGAEPEHPAAADASGLAGTPEIAERLRGLSEEDRRAVASACSISYRRGPDEFENCLRFQLSRRSRRERRPDLRGLDSASREGIESACSLDYHRGPELYDACLWKQYEALSDR